MSGELKNQFGGDGAIKVDRSPRDQAIQERVITPVLGQLERVLNSLQIPEWMQTIHAYGDHSRDTVALDSPVNAETGQALFSLMPQGDKVTLQTVDRINVQSARQVSDILNPSKGHSTDRMDIAGRQAVMLALYTIHQMRLNYAVRIPADIVTQLHTLIESENRYGLVDVSPVDIGQDQVETFVFFGDPKCPSMVLVRIPKTAVGRINDIQKALSSSQKARDFAETDPETIGVPRLSHVDAIVGKKGKITLTFNFDRDERLAYDAQLRKRESDRRNPFLGNQSATKLGALA